MPPSILLHFIVIIAYYGGYRVLIFLMHRLELNLDFPNKRLLPHAERWRLSPDSVLISNDAPKGIHWVLFALWPVWILVLLGRVIHRKRSLSGGFRVAPAIYVGLKAWRHGSPFKPQFKGGDKFSIGCFSGTYHEALAAITAAYSGKLQEAYIVMLNAVARYQDAKPFKKTAKEWAAYIRRPTFWKSIEAFVPEFLDGPKEYPILSDMLSCLWTFLEERTNLTQNQKDLLLKMINEACAQEGHPLFVGQYTRI